MEIILRAHWVLLGGIAAVGAGGNVDWARGTVGSFGLLGPVLLLAYHYSPDRPPSRISRVYFFLMVPVWITLAVFLLSVPNPAFILQQRGVREFWELLPPPPTWLPVVGQLEAAGLEVLFVCGLYAAVVNSWIIPHGRLVYARAWMALGVVAGVLALLGLAQYATHTTNILWIVPTSNTRPFATFPHIGQWCGFALLWMSVNLGLAAWLLDQRGWRLFGVDGWVLLFLSAALDASVAVAGDPFHWLLAGLVTAVGCAVLAWQTAHKRSRGSGPGLGAFVCGAIGLAALAAALGARFSQPSWMLYAGDRPGISLHARVVSDTLAMWLARPWFGWGHASFGIVYSFFQQADQEATYWAYARSDLLQSLAENGLIGTLAWWVPACWLLGKFFSADRIPSFLWTPLAGLAVLAILAIPDFPFTSPAVFFGFWFVLYSVCHWPLLDDTVGKPPPAARHPDPAEQQKAFAARAIPALTANIFPVARAQSPSDPYARPGETAPNPDEEDSTAPRLPPG
jgi:hypothetical protein